MSIAGRWNSNRYSYLDLHVIDRCRSHRRQQQQQKRNDQLLFFFSLSLHSRSHSIISIQDGDVAQQLMFHSCRDFLYDSSYSLAFRTKDFFIIIILDFFSLFSLTSRNKWLMHIFLNTLSSAILVR